MSTTDIFDFGFTAVDEQELDAVQQAEQTIQATSAEASSAQERLERLFNAIQPLLTNLKKNPEKDYIYWPNRLSKVEQFEDLIQGIYSS